MYSKSFEHGQTVIDKTGVEPTWDKRRDLILQRLGAHFDYAERHIEQSQSEAENYHATATPNIEVFGCFEEVESIWTAFARHAAGFYYQQYSWCKTWFDTIGVVNGWHPHIVVVKNAFDDVLMLLPLGVRDTTTAHIVTFAGEGMSDYTAPLILPDFAKTLSEENLAVLWQHVLESFGTQIDLFWSERVAESVAGVPNPLYQLPGKQFRSKAHAVHYPQANDWRASAINLRSKKTVKKIERRIRQLARLGELELTSIHGRENRLAALEHLINLKIENLNNAGIIHAMGKADIRNFYAAMVSDEKNDANLFLFELKCAQKPVASVLAMVHHDTFYYQVCAFNRKEFGRFSPGSLLMYILFEWSFKRDLKFFDMTIGDEGYKEDWANVTTNVKSIAQPLSARGNAAYAMIELKRIGKDQIRDSTFIKPAIMKILYAR